MEWSILNFIGIPSSRTGKRVLCTLLTYKIDPNLFFGGVETLLMKEEPFSA